jgi:hypothetical protein
MLLAACVGTGGQLCLLGLFVILLTIMGTFYEVSGSLVVFWLLGCTVRLLLPAWWPSL